LKAQIDVELELKIKEAQS